MPIGPGSNLDSYELVARLGRGGMGEVYRAWDTKLDRFVALKVLSDMWREDPSSLVRFEREAKVLASLNHPNIVGIFDFSEAEGHAYAVMELLEGRDLREILDEGPLTLRRALEVASQVAMGLSAAHRAGVIHRDLKPANIFMESGGRVKLLDFGIAKRLAGKIPEDGPPVEKAPPTSTNEGVLLGTVGYMAPEQLQSGNPVDARSDLFALGCVLYEMVTGERAFASETSMGTLHAILTQDPDLDRPQLTPGLRELLEHCLAKPQDQRFQDAQDLAYALEALQRPPSGIVPVLETKAKRGRWLLTASLIAGASILLILGGRQRTLPRGLPEFTPLSAFDGQVYTARFHDGGRAVYSIRQGDDSPQVLDASESGEEGLLPWAQGLVPCSVRPDGGWLALKGTRRLDRGHEIFEGDLLLGGKEKGTWRTLADGVSGADASADGSVIVAVRRVGGRYRIEAPMGQIRFESDGWAETPRLSPSGAQLAFIDRPANELGASVVVLDLKDGYRRALLQGWRDLRGLAWAGPDEVWFTGARDGGARGLFAVTLGGKVRALLTNPENLTLQDVDSKGQALICQEHVSFLVVARAPSHDPGSIVGMDPRLLGISWDGQWTTIASPGDVSEGKIYLAQVDREAQSIGQARLAVPSPDGTQAALASQAPGGWRIWIWSRQGSHDMGLKNFNGLRQVAWAPDGKALFLSGAVGTHGFRVWKLAIDSQELTPVCPEGISLERPFLVSPDGRWLLAEIGPLVTRFDLRNPSAPPQSVLGVSPGEQLMGWGKDATHILVAGARLPGQTAVLDLTDGSRETGFPLSAGEHAGALIDNALATQNGEAYAIGYRETRSRLFLVTGLR
jgi:serine/threonine protein kinase/Tol biopolymer transport system component